MELIIVLLTALLILQGSGATSSSHIDGITTLTGTTLTGNTLLTSTVGLFNASMGYNYSSSYSSNQYTTLTDFIAATDTIRVPRLTCTIGHSCPSLATSGHNNTIEASMKSSTTALITLPPSSVTALDSASVASPPTKPPSAKTVSPTQVPGVDSSLAMPQITVTTFRRVTLTVTSQMRNLTGMISLPTFAPVTFVASSASTSNDRLESSIYSGGSKIMMSTTSDPSTNTSSNSQASQTSTTTQSFTPVTANATTANATSLSTASTNTTATNTMTVSTTGLNTTAPSSTTTMRTPLSSTTSATTVPSTSVVLITVGSSTAAVISSTQPTTTGTPQETSTAIITVQPPPATPTTTILTELTPVPTSAPAPSLIGAGGRPQPPRMFFLLTGFAKMAKNAVAQAITTITYEPPCTVNGFCPTGALIVNRTTTVSAPTGTCAPNGCFIAPENPTNAAPCLSPSKLFILLGNIIGVVRRASANTSVAAPSSTPGTTTVTMLVVSWETIDISKTVTIHTPDYTNAFSLIPSLTLSTPNAGNTYLGVAFNGGNSSSVVPTVFSATIGGLLLLVLLTFMIL